jgi:hypothetical protein
MNNIDKAHENVLNAMRSGAFAILLEARISDVLSQTLNAERKIAKLRAAASKDQDG